jgi:hypothetical protein
MMLIDTLTQPSTFTNDDAHRMRLMHMLLRVGSYCGRGKGALAGYVFLHHDGKMYAVTQTDVWAVDYAEFMYAVRKNQIPYYDGPAPIKHRQSLRRSCYDT